MLDPSQFFVVRAVHRVEGVVRVENRLAYDIDDVDVGRFMPYPWVCRWSPTAALRGASAPSLGGRSALPASARSGQAGGDPPPGGSREVRRFPWDGVCEMS
jgi:hypothetical protein